jgi:NitT/TauT family transport system substrate-binding protein
MAEAGVVPDKDVQLIAVGLGASAYEALRTGKVDALNLFDVAHATLENVGTPIRRLELPRHHHNVAGFGFIAHTDSIKNRADMLGRFGRAWAKGLVACYANMPVCVKAFYARRPSSRPAGADEAKLIADGVRNLESRAAAYFAQGPKSNEQIGGFAEQSFKNTISALHSQGILQTANVPVPDLYTNQFVAEFNKFDRNQVRAQAAQAK